MSRVSVAALACLGLSAGDAGAAEAQTGRIGGVVVDARADAPLAGAVVSIAGSRSTETDSAGRFLLCRLEDGAHRLTLRAATFEAADTVVQVGPDEALDVVLQLTPEPPEERPRIVIREGFATPAHRAVFIVDGVRFFYSASGCEDPPPGEPRLDQLERDDIVSIEVMKGPAAAAEYGPDAASGVVLITTRRASTDDP